METISGLFRVVTAGIFTFSAAVLLQLLCFWFRPANSIMRTVRTLRTYHVPSTVPLLGSFLAFALALGVPKAATGAFHGFDGGFSHSLRRLYLIETHGRDFYYLCVFVCLSALLTLLLGSFISALLRLKQRAKRLFPDVFNVFIAFIITWFTVIGVVSAKISSTNLVSTALSKLAIQTPADSYQDRMRVVIGSPAFPLILLVAGYFGYRIMKRWGLKPSFSELIRRRNPGRVFYQTTLAIFPPIIALLIITVSTSLLWVLGQGIFLQTEAGQNFSYQAFCLNNQGKLITSVSVKNNTSNMLTLPGLALGLWVKKPTFDEHGKPKDPPKYRAQIDPGTLLWVSRKGLFVEAGENRFVRLILSRTDTPLFPEEEVVEYCKVQNDPGDGTIKTFQGKPLEKLRIDLDAISTAGSSSE